MLLLAVNKFKETFYGVELKLKDSPGLVPIQKMQNLDISYSYSQIISNIAIIFACK